MERLIKTPSRHPRSALQISTPRTASDPRPHQAPSWRRVGRRLTTPQLPRRICRHTVRACDLRTRARRRTGRNAGARVIITGLSRWDGCTEASSRSALHAAIDPYSNIYACTLVSPWNYKRRDSGIDQGENIRNHTHT